MELSLRDAMQIAISDNRDVQLARLLPELAGLDQEIANTVYDPLLFSDTTYYHNIRPIQTLLDTGSDGSDGDTSLDDTGWTAQAGIKQPLPTGGYAVLKYEADHLDSNSDLTIPNPQYTSRVRLELRQALLQGFADVTNSTKIELAGLALATSELDVRQAVNNVLKDLSLYYWRYKYYHELEQISQLALSEGEVVIARLLTRYEQGLANMLDLDRAVSSLQDRKLRLLADRKSARATLDQLKQVLGIPAVSPFFRADVNPVEPYVEKVTVPDQDEVLTTAMAMRSEIAAARKVVSAAMLKLKLAEHLQLPVVDAKSSYGLNGLGEEFGDSVEDSVDGDQPSWDVGLVMEWSIGGRKAAIEMQKSHLALRKAHINYKKEVEKIVYEVKTLHSEMTLSEEEVLAAKKAESAYEKVLGHDNTLFAMSRINNQRLLDSQDEYYNAKRTYLRSLLDLNLAFLRLQWAQGLLLERFDLQM